MCCVAHLAWGSDCSVYEWYAIVIAGLLTHHYHPEESGLTHSAYSESLLLG